MAVKLNYGTAALRVCVDRNDRGRLHGRIVSQRLRAPITFADVTDMIIQVDGVLDAQKFPQAFQRIRSFSPGISPDVPAARSPEEMLPAEMVNAQHGTVDTFIIHVQSRRSASWQGMVDWMDDSPRQPFGSTLELIMFIAERFYQK